MCALDKFETQRSVIFIKVNQFGRPFLTVGTHHQKMIKARCPIRRQLSLGRFGCCDIFHLLPIIAGRDLVDQLKLNMAKHAILVGALQIVSVSKTPKDFAIITPEWCCRKQHPTRVLEHVECRCPRRRGAVVRFVNQDQVEQIRRRYRDLLDVRANAGHRGNYHVELPQSFPLDRVGNSAGGCHHFRIRNVGGDRTEALQNAELLEVVGDLLAHQATGR